MPEGAEGKSILFICSGNICRSPMAGLIAEIVFDKEGIPYSRIETAGTLGIHGQPAAPPAVAATRELGLDLSKHVSKGVTTALLDQADYVLVMSPEHTREVKLRRPSAEVKIVQLWEFTNQPDRLKQIADPIGRDYLAYITCRNDLVECIRNWVKSLGETGQ